MWCCDMANRLVDCGHEVSMIVHSADAGDVSYACPLDSRITMHRCDGVSGLHARPRDVAQFMRVYERLKPGLLFPNYSVGTFAACAELVNRRSGDFRMVSVLGGVQSRVAGLCCLL